MSVPAMQWGRRTSQVDHHLAKMPVGSQQGRAAVSAYYQRELKNCLVRWNVKKTIVMGRSAVALIECETAPSGGDARAKVDMAIVSGRSPPPGAGARRALVISCPVHAACRFR
jgi:hypothetical protein